MKFNVASEAWYKDWFGKDYLKVYPHRDEIEAKTQIDFAERVLHLNVGSIILDLGCGNGRHALALAQRGHLMTCFDLSSELLAIARQSAAGRDNMRFVQGDMRYLPFIRTFDVVVSFFTTFGYFHEDSENLKTLLGINRVLKPGGRFLQDYVNKDYVIENLNPHSVQLADGYEIMQERQFNAVTQRIEKRITLNGSGEKKEYFESVRLYNKNEMTTLLQNAGLTLDESYGDFEGRPFSSSSPRLILIGHRATA